MASGSNITISIAADVKKVVDGVSTTNKELGKLQKIAGSVGPTLKGSLASDAITTGVSTIKNAIGDAFSTVQQQGQLAAQTEAALKSTGNQAGISATAITELANSIEGKSTVDAEAIHQGENLLLTFTNIKNSAGAGNDIFNQTTQIMADMATAMGTEPKAAAMQLGKALNDPVKGVGALSKVGVTFTAQQKAQIKAMQEAGNTAGAQRIILAELNKEFGGSAEASSKTFAGAMFQIKDTLGGVLEGAITAIMPTLTAFGAWFAEKLPGWIDTAQGAFSRVHEALTPVIDAIGTFIGWMKENPETVKAFAITLGILAGGIGIVTAAQAAWNAVMALNPIGLVIIGIAALVAAIVWVVTHWDKVKSATSGAWDAMNRATSGALHAMVDTIKRKISDAVGWFTGLPGRAANALAGLAGDLTRIAGNAGDWLAVTIGNKVGEALQWFLNFPGNTVAALGDMGSLLFGAGRDIVRGLMGGIDDLAGAAWRKVEDLGKRLGEAAKHALGIRSPSRVFAGIGRDTVRGLLGAIDGSLTDVSAAGRSVAEALIPSGGLSFGDVAYPTITGTPAGAALAPITLNVYAPIGSNPVEIGRQLVEYIDTYHNAGGRRR